MTDNGQRSDDGACLYYKLTNEPKGSAELKRYLSNSRTATAHASLRIRAVSPKHLQFAQQYIDIEEIFSQRAKIQSRKIHIQ